MYWPDLQRTMHVCPYVCAIKCICWDPLILAYGKIAGQRNIPPRPRSWFNSSESGYNKPGIILKACVHVLVFVNVKYQVRSHCKTFIKSPLLLQIWAIQSDIPHCHFGLEAGGFLALDKTFIITVMIINIATIIISTFVCHFLVSGVPTRPSLEVGQSTKYLADCCLKGSTVIIPNKCTVHCISIIIEMSTLDCNACLQ